VSTNVHLFSPFSLIKKLEINELHGFYIHPASPGIEGWGAPWTYPYGGEVPIPGTPYGEGQIRFISHPPTAPEWKILHRPGTWVYGNIDWIGHNEKPEKPEHLGKDRLSYWGPQSRYFRDPDFDYDAEDKHHEIYEDGRYLSVAPLPVLGAALQTIESEPDPQTGEITKHTYLLAICKDGFDDKVFIRVKPSKVIATEMTPTLRNEMMELWHPEDNPQGWTIPALLPQIIDGNSQANEADTPWFFNASGNECQCMRSWDNETATGLTTVVEEDVKFRYKMGLKILTVGNVPSIDFEVDNLFNEAFNQSEELQMGTGYWGRMSWVAL